MHPSIEAIQRESKDLLFMSESDHPFEVIHFQKPEGTITDHLKKLVGAEGPVDAPQTVPYFFRNATRTGETTAEEATAKRFRQLQQTVEAHLKNAAVYRIGTVQVHAFIIGELPDGSYAGLRTLLIET